MDESAITGESAPVWLAYAPAMSTRAVIRAAAASALVVTSLVALGGLAAAEPGFTSVHRMPAPVGATNPPDAPYGAVSCASATSCTAVGPYGHITAEGKPTVVTQTAGVWGTPQAIALPAGGVAGGDNPAQLDAVSCPSVGDCTAVGNYPTATSTLPLAVTESSGTWGSASAPPLPTGAATGSKASAALEGVTCTAAGDCTAVGAYRDAGGATQFMVAVETPAPGARRRSPERAERCDDRGRHPSRARRRATARSWPAPPTAQAFGTYAWTETSGTWSGPVAISAPSGTIAIVNGLGCPMPTTCLAVGFGSAGGNVEALTATENGGTWGPFTVMAPPRCRARRGGAARPLVRRRDLRSRRCGDPDGQPGRRLSGRRHLVGRLVELHGLRAVRGIGQRVGQQPALTGVSCTSSTQCLAVGGAAVYPYKSANEPNYSFSTVLTPTRPVTTPGPPASVLAAPVRGGAAVTWQPPLDDGGAPITGATATATPGGASCTSSGTGCTITGSRRPSVEP